MPPGARWVCGEDKALARRGGLLSYAKESSPSESGKQTVPHARGPGGPESQDRREPGTAGLPGALLPRPRRPHPQPRSSLNFGSEQPASSKRPWIPKVRSPQTPLPCDPRHHLPAPLLPSWSQSRSPLRRSTATRGPSPLAHRVSQPPEALRPLGTPRAPSCPPEASSHAAFSAVLGLEELWRRKGFSPRKGASPGGSREGAGGRGGPAPDCAPGCSGRGLEPSPGRAGRGWGGA